MIIIIITLHPPRHHNNHVAQPLRYAPETFLSNKDVNKYVEIGS